MILLKMQVNRYMMGLKKMQMQYLMRLYILMKILDIQQMKFKICLIMVQRMKFICMRVNPFNLILMRRTVRLD